MRGGGHVPSWFFRVTVQYSKMYMGPGIMDLLGQSCISGYETIPRIVHFVTFTGNHVCFWGTLNTVFKRPQMLLNSPNIISAVDASGTQMALPSPGPPTMLAFPTRLQLSFIAFKALQKMTDDWVTQTGTHGFNDKFWVSQLPSDDIGSFGVKCYGLDAFLGWSQPGEICTELLFRIHWDSWREAVSHNFTSALQRQTAVLTERYWINFTASIVVAPLIQVTNDANTVTSVPTAVNGVGGICSVCCRCSFRHTSMSTLLRKSVFLNVHYWDAFVIM